MTHKSRTAGMTNNTWESTRVTSAECGEKMRPSIPVSVPSAHEEITRIKDENFGDMFAVITAAASFMHVRQQSIASHDATREQPKASPAEEPSG